MLNVNRVFLSGNLTRDVELRSTAGGKPACDLGLAHNEKWTGKDGEVKEEVVFIDVSVWDKQAESCAQYLHKGSQVYVEARIKLESWSDKATGEKRSKIKLVADRVQFLDPKPDESAPGASAPTAERQAPQSTRATAGAPKRPGRPVPAPAPEEEDDQIPF